MTKDFQLRYWGGEHDGPKGYSAAYEHLSTAVRCMTDAIRSRRYRAPGSHVLLQDKSQEPPLVLARWDGYDPGTGDRLVLDNAAAAAYGDDPLWQLSQLARDLDEQ